MGNYLLLSTLLKVILGLTGIFGIGQLNRIRDRFAQGIIILMVISIGFQFIPSSGWKAMGVLFFVLGGLAATIYAIVKDLSILHRAVIILICLPIVIKHVFMILHLPGARETSLAMLVSFVVYLVFALPRHRQFKNEIGFLTISVVLAIVLTCRVFLGSGLLR